MGGGGGGVTVAEVFPVGLSVASAVCATEETVCAVLGFGAS